MIGSSLGIIEIGVSPRAAPEAAHLSSCKVLQSRGCMIHRAAVVQGI